jgi:type VI secretion system secreted protein VgrG
MIFTRTARVFTTAGDGVLLFMSMTGTEALGRPFQYDLELLAAHEQLALVDLLGQPMTIQLEMTDTGVREFSGLVTSFSLAGEVGTRVRYLATLRPGCGC